MNLKYILLIFIVIIIILYAISKSQETDIEDSNGQIIKVKPGIVDSLYNLFDIGIDSAIKTAFELLKLAQKLAKEAFELAQRLIKEALGIIQKLKDGVITFAKDMFSPNGNQVIKSFVSSIVNIQNMLKDVIQSKNNMVKALADATKAISIISENASNEAEKQLLITAQTIYNEITDYNNLMPNVINEMTDYASLAPSLLIEAIISLVSFMTTSVSNAVDFAISEGSKALSLGQETIDKLLNVKNLYSLDAFKTVISSVKNNILSIQNIGSNVTNTVKDIGYFVKNCIDTVKIITDEIGSINENAVKLANDGLTKVNKIANTAFEINDKINSVLQNINNLLPDSLAILISFVLTTISKFSDQAQQTYNKSIEIMKSLMSGIANINSYTSLDGFETIITNTKNGIVILKENTIFMVQISKDAIEFSKQCIDLGNEIDLKETLSKVDEKVKGIASLALAISDIYNESTKFMPDISVQIIMLIASTLGKMLDDILIIPTELANTVNQIILDISNMNTYSTIDGYKNLFVNIKNTISLFPNAINTTQNQLNSLNNFLSKCYNLSDKIGKDFNENPVDKALSQYTEKLNLAKNIIQIINNVLKKLIDNIQIPISKLVEFIKQSIGKIYENIIYDGSQVKEIASSILPKLANIQSIISGSEFKNTISNITNSMPKLYNLSSDVLSQSKKAGEMMIQFSTISSIIGIEYGSKAIDDVILSMNSSNIDSIISYINSTIKKIDDLLNGASGEFINNIISILTKLVSLIMTNGENVRELTYNLFSKLDNLQNITDINNIINISNDMKNALPQLISFGKNSSENIGKILSIISDTSDIAISIGKNLEEIVNLNSAKSTINYINGAILTINNNIPNIGSILLNYIIANTSIIFNRIKEKSEYYYSLINELYSMIGSNDFKNYNNSFNLLTKIPAITVETINNIPSIEKDILTLEQIISNTSSLIQNLSSEFGRDKIVSYLNSLTITKYSSEISSIKSTISEINKISGGFIPKIFAFIIGSITSSLSSVKAISDPIYKNGEQLIYELTNISISIKAITPDNYNKISSKYKSSVQSFLNSIPNAINEYKKLLNMIKTYIDEIKKYSTSYSSNNANIMAENTNFKTANMIIESENKLYTLPKLKDIARITEECNVDINQSKIDMEEKVIYILNMDDNIFNSKYPNIQKFQLIYPIKERYLNKINELKNKILPYQATKYDYIQEEIRLIKTNFGAMQSNPDLPDVLLFNNIKSLNNISDMALFGKSLNEQNSEIIRLRNLIILSEQLKPIKYNATYLGKINDLQNTKTSSNTAEHIFIDIDILNLKEKMRGIGRMENSAEEFIDSVDRHNNIYNIDDKHIVSSGIVTNIDQNIYSSINENLAILENNFNAIKSISDKLEEMYEIISPLLDLALTNLSDLLAKYLNIISDCAMKAFDIANIIIQDSGKIVVGKSMDALKALGEGIKFLTTNSEKIISSIPIINANPLYSGINVVGNVLSETINITKEASKTSTQAIEVATTTYTNIENSISNGISNIGGNIIGGITGGLSKLL